MTLQEFLEKNSEKIIVDAGGVEWLGSALQDEFLSAGEDGALDLSRDTHVFLNGRIFFTDETEGLIETGLRIN